MRGTRRVLLAMIGDHEFYDFYIYATPRCWYSQIVL